ncbi:MAG TPA: hypothetical protein VJC37_02395 [Planctomycetota bacterium]|nr:hypothetical protein [Planctomycetota bacterium]
MASKRGSDWIPNQDGEFFDKQGSYVDRVDTNKAAWGIPDADIQVLKDLRAEYEPLYMKIRSKKDRTSAQVGAHRDCRKRYEKAWRAFHKEWVLNNRRIPISELLILSGRKHDTKLSPKPKIDDIPWVGLSPMGGGWIKVTCRRWTDEDSPSMHNDADVIECRYTFLPVHLKPIEGKKFFFPTPEECPYVQNSTRARFIIKCVSEGVGMKFYGYFRWVNLSNPANNGSWTNGLQVVIA